MELINISKLFEHVIVLSILASILSIGILLIKVLFRQKLSAKVHYYIWFIFVLRLIIPFSIESPLSLFNIVPQYHQVAMNPIIEQGPARVQTLNISVSNGTAPLRNENNNSISANKEVGFNFSTFTMLWLVGIAGILLYIITINASFLLKLKRYSPCERPDIIENLEECKLKLNMNSRVSVVNDIIFRPPLVCGLINPKILISPEIINRLSEEELKYVFLHELAHIKRRDLLVNIALVLIQAIYWFNPMIWYSLHKMKQDSEISCDATVMDVLNSNDNKKYGRTIIRMMEMISAARWVPGTLGFANKYNRRRITMITLFKRSSARWTAASIVILMLISGYSSLTSAATATSPQNQDNLKTSNSKLKSGNQKNSFIQYVSLLGLSKEKLKSTLKEKPYPVDEGGLEFKKAGIRVWFNNKNNSTVSQIFTQRKDIDMNGVKIGDSINKFIKVFGNPISDKNGDMHFKYKKTAFISVMYDKKTKATYAVYFLKENF